MKINIFLPLMLISSALFSQVGINTDTPKVNLDVKPINSVTSVDGMIFPQLSLSELTAKGNDLYTNQHTSTVIYIKDISGGNTQGQRANITSEGYYYFDGSLWQNLYTGDMENIYNTNGQLSANRTANMDGKTVSIINNTGTELANQFSIDGSTFSVDFINNKVGIGTTEPNARLDLRPNPTSTTDPGEGFIGIGTNSSEATDVGPGAIRYNTVDNGRIQYSNGMAWNTLQAIPDKLTVIAKNTTPFVISSDTNYILGNWTEISDTENVFDAQTGVFTAPRDGNYLLTFSYAFDPSYYLSNSKIQAILSLPNDVDNKITTVNVNNDIPTNTDIVSNARIAFVISLAENESVSPMIFQSSGSDKTLKIDQGFNSFTVAEL